MPTELAKKIEELKKIVADYPEDIPVQVIAKFLGWKETTVRSAIELGNFPGIYYSASVTGRRTYKILSLPFWMYYTQGKVGV